MKIEVKLFAMARQRLGQESVLVDLPPNATVQDLRQALAKQCPMLAPALGQIRFAVNNDYASDEAVIPEAAELACIPPVSGG
jgi:sulfur-carrier protein